MKTICHLKNKTGTRELHIKLKQKVEERQTFLCACVCIYTLYCDIQGKCGLCRKRKNSKGSKKER